MRFIRELVSKKVHEQSAEDLGDKVEDEVSAGTVASDPGHADALENGSSPFETDSGLGAAENESEPTATTEADMNSGGEDLWSFDDQDSAADSGNEASNVVEVPAPAAGRAGRRASRVKTRLLGFEHSDGKIENVFDKGRSDASTQPTMFPVGWIVVVSGPGRGASIPLKAGVSPIGRGEGEAVQLDFGDNSISRNNHAAIAYDDEQHKFFLGHGGKSNIVRLNEKPVLSTEPLSDGDLIRLGETTLRFVALCGENFQWEVKDNDDDGTLA